MDESITLPELAQRCLDSQGYVFFVAMLTNKKDVSGRLVIDSHYGRYNFSIDDALSANRDFRQHIQQDMAKLTESDK